MTGRDDLNRRLRTLAEMIPDRYTLPSGYDTVICSLEAFMQIKKLVAEAADALENDAAGTPIQEDSPLTGLTKFSWRECGDNQPMSKDTVYCCPNPVCGKRRLFEWQLTNYCPDCGLRLFKPVPQTKDGGQDE